MAGRQTVILDFLDDDLKLKIDEFRNKTTSIDNKSRSLEEQRIHFDKYCSDRDIKKWIIILENDEVIGTTAIFSRQIVFDKQETLLGGVGKVRVRDDKRKMGLASQMMDEAIKQLNLINSDIAYLCTDTNSFLVRFYEKYGFTKMDKPYTYLSRSGKKYTEQDGMLAPIKSKQAYDKIMQSSEPLDLGLGNW